MLWTLVNDVINFCTIFKWHLDYYSDGQQCKNMCYEVFNWHFYAPVLSYWTGIARPFENHLELRSILRLTSKLIKAVAQIVSGVEIIIKILNLYFILFMYSLVSHFFPVSMSRSIETSYVDCYESIKLLPSFPNFPSLGLI